MECNAITVAATVVSAAAATVYTVGTFMLWCTTRRQQRATEDALKLAFLQAFQAAKAKNSAGLMGDTGILFIDPGYQDLLKKVFPRMSGEFGLD